jgi:superfamily I DNA/RNA helicase
MLLDSLDGGDFKSRRYQHVIVDEFQDLTPGEQELFLKLRRDGGYFLALGDARQSIYAFRGNDREGLAKLEKLLSPVAGEVTDIDMTECQRCPPDIVTAANQLMDLSKVKPMLATSKVKANTHVVVWDNPVGEAQGMADAIVANFKTHPEDRHLAMVTRRQFGYALRECIAAIDADFKVELSFSESLLETWAVREAFLFFCLLVDPDAPTWRAWLGYENSSTGKGYKAPQRNAAAYLKVLTESHDDINDTVIEEIADSEKKPAGAGGKNVWDRAKRFIDLRADLFENGDDARVFITEIFDANAWVTPKTEDDETSRLDMQLCFDKAMTMLEEVEEAHPKWKARQVLAELARRLRYQIATREPFASDDESDLQVATLWGAKGVTADHVYVLGLAAEAIPGERREEYPGTDTEFSEEQRRLFYVPSRGRRRRSFCREHEGSGTARPNGSG